MSAAETRRLWLAIHRYLGLASLVFLFIAGVTGCVLVFDKPLDAALNPDLFRLTQADQRVEPLAAVAGLEQARPDLRVTSAPLAVDPGSTLLVNVEARDAARPLPFNQAFLGPGGGLAGTRQLAAGWDRRHIVQGIYEFHYTLLGGAPGRWLMGAMALAWFISNLVGLYLTLPMRGPFWRNWAKAWRFSIRAKLARVLLHLHQASGLWLLAPLTVLAFTSVNMNFFDEAFTPVVQAVSPARPSPFERPASPAAPGPRLGFDRAIELASLEARGQGFAWRPAQVGYVADRDLYQVTFTRSGRVNYARLGPVSYYLEGTSGRLLYVDDPYHDSRGRQLSRALYPLHSGQVAGWVGEAVVFLLGLATAAQCVTGGYLWLKRRPPRVAARRAERASRLAGRAA